MKRPREGNPVFRVSKRTVIDRLLTTMVAILFLAISPLAAQKMKFNPLIAIEQGYTDNVGFAGSTEESDSQTRLQIVLPWERETRASLFRFRYSPSFTQFHDFDELDNDGHRISLEFDRDLKSGSELEIRVRADRSQTQGDATSVDDADLFLTRRTEREQLRADLRYRGNLKGRWGWAGSLGAATTSFKEITGFEMTPPLNEVEDRDEVRVGVGLTRSVSRRSSLGLAYDYAQFKLDNGDEDSHRVSVVGNYEISRTERLRYSVGGFHSTGVEAEGGGSDDDSRSGVSSSLGYEKKMKRTALNLALQHRPTSGGARRGTSTNTSLALGLNGHVSDRWRWNASARYARRNPSDSAAADLDSVSVGGGVELDISGVLGIRLQTNYITQSGGDSAFDETTVIVARLGIVWHPLGRTELAR